jgi:hypothetical protein
MGFHLMNIAEYCVKIPTNLDYCLLEQSEAFMFPFNDGDLAKTKPESTAYSY